MQISKASCYAYMFLKFNTTANDYMNDYIFDLWFFIFFFFDFMWSFIWILFRHVHSIIPVRLHDQSEQLISILYLLLLSK